MRSPVWFVVAAVIAVAGFAGAVFYLMPRLAAADARMMRVVVPGNAMLVFDKPGPYMIYHEKKSTVDGRTYASDNVDGLSLGLTADATGAQVKLVAPKITTSYTIGDRSGTSIYAFTLDQPGRYRLAANLASSRGDPKAVLAIEQGMFGALLSTIFGTIAIAFAGLGVAGAIVFAVLWQRSKAAKSVATG
ncbi:MAG TPA: hypothetical protein VF949_04585 [Reyranella sp.]